MANTLAIHWAATTHGTWLHGDPRGSWKDGKLIGPDPFLEAQSRAILASDAIVLKQGERDLIGTTFGKIVREQRYRVFAATIQPTHVHLVFGPLRENIDTVIARLKRRSALEVLSRRREQTRPARMAGLYSRPILGRPSSTPRSLWTAGKFIVFIFDERHLMNLIEYVRDHNRRDGLAADPYDWIDPLYPPPPHVGERCFPDRSAKPRL